MTDDQSESGVVPMILQVHMMECLVENKLGAWIEMEEVFQLMVQCLKKGLMKDYQMEQSKVQVKDNLLGIRFL